jgi:hypothetical protein
VEAHSRAVEAHLGPKKAYPTLSEKVEYLFFSLGYFRAIS